jgi:hypothetical protein
MSSSFLAVLIVIELLIAMASFCMPSLNPVVRIILGVIGFIGGIALLVYAVLKLRKTNCIDWRWI